MPLVANISYIISFPPKWALIKHIKIGLSFSDTTLWPRCHIKTLILPVYEVRTFFGLNIDKVQAIQRKYLQISKENISNTKLWSYFDDFEYQIR